MWVVEGGEIGRLVGNTKEAHIIIFCGQGGNDLALDVFASISCWAKTHSVIAEVTGVELINVVLYVQLQA